MARGKKTGGRRQGSRNRVTIERELIAERTIAEAKAAGRPLAKEVLDEFMHAFARTAARCRRRGDRTGYERWALHSIDCAKALAPYQSPRLSAVAVGAAVVNKIEVIGGMPPDFEPPAELAAVLPAGTIVTADDEAAADGKAA